MRTGLALLFMGAMAVTLSATVHRAVDIPALAKGAEKVVVASVQQVDARFDTNEFGDKLIVSDAALRVEETLKGAHSASATVTVEGGTVGNLTLDVSDMPVLKAGDRAVVFLRRTAAGGTVPQGRGVGIMKLDGNNRIEDSDLTLDDVRQAVRANR